MIYKKTIIVFILLLSSFRIFADEEVTNAHNNSEMLSYDYTIIDFPFMAKEIIECSKVDTTFLQSKIIQDKFRKAENIKPYDLYINDFCVNAFVDSLKTYRNENNETTVDSLIRSIPIHTPILEGFEWKEIYFTGYDFNHYNFDDYVLFALLYKGEDELMPLFKMENGSVWKNILLDYEHGEKIITPIKYSNKIQCEYERERVHYLINKWSFSQLSQTKELVSTLHTSLSYLKEDPIDSKTLLTGVWKGTMNREDIVIKIRVEHGYVILSYDWKSIKEENIRLHYIDYGYKIESDEESLKNKGIKLTLNKDGKMKIKIGKSYSNNLSKIKQK